MKRAIHFYLDGPTLKILDNFAISHHISRSSAITFITHEFFKRMYLKNTKYGI